MFNTGLKKYETADVNNFTSDMGIKLRRYINKPWRNVLRYYISRKVIIEQYPNLEENKVYIFAANHSFDEDVITTIYTIDRNVYVVNGSSNQTEHNPVFYALWFNGMVFVNRRDGNSRKDAVQKMKRILMSGNSVMLFPEATWNLSPNKIHLPITWGIIDIAKKMDVPIVPAVIEYDYDNRVKGGKGRINHIHVRYGETVLVDALDDMEEKTAELEEKFLTVRFSVWEQKGIHRRSDIDMWEYQYFITQKLNSFPMLDMNQENNCIFGNSDEFYQYFYINEVPCDAWGIYYGHRR